MYRPLSPSSQGFTRFELVCVTAVLGLLGAIAFPSFFNQACACKGEALTSVGSLARAQQAFFFENGEFTSSWAALKSGMPSETEDYAYRVLAQEREAIAYAQSKNSGLHSYVSATFLIPTETGQTQAETVICKAKSPGIEPVAPPIDLATCGEGTERQVQSELRNISR